jgi:hypothetical protein
MEGETGILFRTYVVITPARFRRITRKAEPDSAKAAEISEELGKNRGIFI